MRYAECFGEAGGATHQELGAADQQEQTCEEGDASYRSVPSAWLTLTARSVTTAKSIAVMVAALAVQHCRIG
jgi:hypothetical protein